MERFIKKNYDFGQCIVIGVLAALLLYAGYIVNSGVFSEYDRVFDFIASEIFITSSYIVGGFVLLLLILIGILYLLAFKKNTSIIIDIVDGILYGIFLIVNIGAFSCIYTTGAGFTIKNFIEIIAFAMFVLASAYWIKSFELKDNRIKNRKTNRTIYLIILLSMVFGAAFGAYNILFDGFSSDVGYAYVQAYNVLLPLITIGVAKFTYNYQLALQKDFLELGDKISKGKRLASKKIEEVKGRVEKAKKAAPKKVETAPKKVETTPKKVETTPKKTTTTTKTTKK